MVTAKSFIPSSYHDNLFLPDAFLDVIAKTSSVYAKKNVSKRKYAPIKWNEVLTYLEVYQYMRLVDLSAKKTTLQMMGTGQTTLF